ncbi:hypothetical protein CFK37_10045 [Virgibacillus phasianinus]|uniref:Lipoprotein n=1 Tax=Virgibacillus phasianinus TaxID=2017483 RepID=A0A220U3G2_9BACI|nr:hypothetical protein [Virgibacillus phasianinus]ASK62466.1 hypothetical protein CFK37_10045 [Virgibacillus phasianinus]
MLKRVIILSIIISITVLAACSEATNSTNEGQKQDDNSAKDHTSEDSNKGEDKQDKKEKEEKKEKPAEPTYKPIEPPKDTKPLKEKYSPEVKKNMPAAEAHGADPTRTVPLGETLLKGKKDLTDGPLKNNRLVAFYGTPKSENMGILGEYPPEVMMEKLKEQAAAYSKLDPERPAVPTIELIATVAQRKPGPEGLYISGPSKEVIDQYAQLAKENNALLLLDIQLGQATVMEGLKKVEPYLKLPYVHLAIDTEYSVEEGEVPGVNLGHVDGSSIQKAVERVDEIVEKNNLPDKLVVVHQFGNGIVTNKDKIKPTSNVEVALNYDGFGDAAIKMSAYGKLVRQQPIQYGGFKLFYENDKPLLTPKQVLKLDPAPAIVDYQ